MITLIESDKSRALSVSRDDGSVTVKYIAFGSRDHTAIYAAAILDTTPSFVAPWGALLWRSEIAATPKGGDSWDIDVVYKDIPQNEALGETITEPVTPDLDAPLGAGHGFSTSGGTTHITHSRSTVAAYVIGGAGVIGTNCPDYKQGINVTRESIEGVDIVTANPELSIDVRRNFVTLRYFNKICGLTGTVNNADWKGFPAGEMLYLGCEGRYTANEGWTLTHKFAHEPNQNNLAIGGITVTSKRGWDYLWVGYAPQVSGGYATQIPIHAYVESVYRYTNFAQLEIGV